MDQLNIYRGIILVYPHGSFIKQNKKSIIVKSRYISSIINYNLLLIEGKLALGTIKLGDAKKINLDQFVKLSKYHQITEEERDKWWGAYTTLYVYPIVKRRIFKIPLLIEYPPGPQITVKPENIFLRRAYVGMAGYFYLYMYPKNTKDLLEYYSDHLNSVEINATFYSFPSDALITNLAKYDLHYSIKVSRYITHSKKLKDIKSYWNDFYHAFKPIYNKIICFLFQFSSAFIYNESNLTKITNLSEILSKDHKYAFEFRRIEWFSSDDVDKLFKRNNWTLVISNVTNKKSWAGNLHDGFNPPLETYNKTSDLLYIRMHGTVDKYIGSYPNDILKEIFEFIKMRNEDDSMIFFNNTDRDAEAFNDAILLSKKFNPLNI